jgi:hypothetical protein
MAEFISIRGARENNLKGTRDGLLVCDDLAVLPVIGSAAIETADLSIGRGRRRIPVRREHDGLIPTHGAAIRGLRLVTHCKQILPYQGEEL